MMKVTELFWFAIWQLRMDRIVRNVHNDRHSAMHPEASQNAYHCGRCVQSELSAKNHKPGYSIIINNSVDCVHSKACGLYLSLREIQCETEIYILAT